MSGSRPCGRIGHRGGRSVRAVLLGALASLVIAAGCVPRPADAAASVEITGSGFGHGHGMSQYGAHGRAQAGQSYAQILSAYYPGTALTTGSDNSQIRVLISADTDNRLTVRAEAAMTVRTASGTAALPATVPEGVPSEWRIMPVAGSLVLHALVDGVWRLHGSSAIDSLLAGQVTADLAASDGTIQIGVSLGYREHVGAARAVLVTATTQQAVVVTTMAGYLPSVVTSEMPSSWHAQALAAQAVAARSYAMFDQRSKPASARYDTCDTTACQVYNGIAEYSASGTLLRSFTTTSTRTAVTTTAGQYLAYQGAPAFTQFSASNGGYSAAGSRPYLTAAPDPFDTYPDWQVTLTAAQIQRAYPRIGILRTILTVQDGRGGHGGRVTSVVLTGSSGSTTVTGAAFRSTFGLRSTMFAATLGAAASPQRDVTGDGLPDLLARDQNGLLYRWNGLGGARFGARTQIGHGWQNLGPLTLAYDLSASRETELLAVDARSGRMWSYATTVTGGLSAPRMIGSSGWGAMNMLLPVTGFIGTEAGLLVRHAGTGRLYYYASNGRGGLQNGVEVGSGWNAMRLVTAAGDWDGNGHADLLAVDASGSLWLYPSRGDGRFAARVRLGAGWSSMTAIIGGADWDGNGALDLVGQTRTGSLILYPGTPSGGLMPSRQIGNGWSTFALIN